MDIPNNFPKFTSDSDVIFQYHSTPQRNSGLWNNGTLTLVVGRVLSGSSGVNGMWFNRGHPRDFDTWGNETHDSSWNYSNMLKYFKRVETYAGDFPSDQHGYSGPITVSRPRYAPGLEHWLSAGRTLGYPIADPNGPQQRSFATVEYAQRLGRRVNAFVGYIQPILHTTPKLKIILNTNVTRIIFEGNRAVGLQFQSIAPQLQGSQDNCLYANKEIIVSAGAYGSALLLLRSGIGPTPVLRTSGIPLVKELPVGENFQDHVVVPLALIINNGSKSMVKNPERDLTPENWEFYKRFGDGPYSSNLGGIGQAFVVSSVAQLNGERDWPDIHNQMLHSTESFSLPRYFDQSSLIRSSDEVAISVWTSLTRPKSRGSLKLNPRDPNGLPIVDVGFLSDERDMDALLDGLKQTFTIFEETPSYQALGAYIPHTDIPMCRKFRFRTDNYWRCYIRYVAGSGYHPGGTCKMGSGHEDLTAVVDTKLRVIGIDGLRVVDASIVPVQTNTNTHAAVYGIAEKASEMILSDWSISVSSKHHRFKIDSFE